MGYVALVSYASPIALGLYRSPKHSYYMSVTPHLA